MEQSSHDIPQISQRTMQYYQIFEDRPTFYTFSYNYVCDKHLHKEIEVLYVRQGEQLVTIHNRTFRVGQRQTLFICDNTLHQFTHNPMAEISILKFMPEWLMPDFLPFPEKEKLREFLASTTLVDASPVIDHCFSALSSNKESFSSLYIYARIIDLLLHIQRSPHMILETYSVQFKSTTYLDTLQQYMQEHCCEPLTLKMLADHLGLTESYCSRYFKNKFGVSFIEYLNALRINYAQRLLIYTSDSIMEISLKSGFSSIQTFNRVFKKMSGMSPTQYRSRSIAP